MAAELEQNPGQPGTMRCPAVASSVKVWTMRRYSVACSGRPDPRVRVRVLKERLTRLVITCWSALSVFILVLAEPMAYGETVLKRAARISHEEIVECSGMAFTGGALWAHNDSGSGAVLYRSTTLDFSNAEALSVPGAENVDWEDLAVLDGDILACDIGDNARKRPTVTVYRVRYVAASEGWPAHLKLIATYPIRYPDGPHDAEAAFTIDGKLYIVVKRRSERTTTVFRFDELRDVRELAGKVNAAVLVGELDLAKREQITAADYDAHTGTVVLLSYRHLYQYPKTRLSGAPAKEIRLKLRQYESVCVMGRQVIISTEQRDVYVIDDFLSKD